VLLHLAAFPQPFDVVASSYEDMALQLGLSTGQVSRAIGKLVKRACIGRSASRGWGGSGNAPNLYRVNDPHEWGLVPWRLDRREAMIRLSAFLALQAREQDILNPRAWAREQRLLRPRAAAREIRGGQEASIRAQLRAGSADSYSRAAVRGFSPPPPPNYCDRLGVRRDETGGGGEGFQLSERQRELVDAFFAGVPGLQELAGHPLRRLCRIADESNGELERLVKLARSMQGPDRWLDRIGQLEAAMTAGDDEVPGAKSQPMSGRLRSLHQSLAGARAAGDAELVAELETEIVLASAHPSVTMGPCESGSEQ
jgi:hypothetical protein